MPPKKHSPKLKRFNNEELLIIGRQLKPIAKEYLNRITDFKDVGLSCVAPIWLEGPEIFGFAKNIQSDFCETELQRVERSITDWPCTPLGAAAMRERLRRHELYRKTGDLADSGLNLSGLYLEKIRKADLGGYAKKREHLEKRVLQARQIDMVGFGFSNSETDRQLSSLKIKRGEICNLIEELNQGFKREPKSGGFITFSKSLRDGWQIRLKITESDLLNTVPIQTPHGRLHIATNKFHLELVDEIEKRFSSYALEDLVPIKNSLSNNVFSRVYDSVEQLLFSVQASVISYGVVEEEFEAGLLRGIEEVIDHRLG